MVKSKTKKPAYDLKPRVKFRLNQKLYILDSDYCGVCLSTGDLISNN